MPSFSKLAVLAARAVAIAATTTITFIDPIPSDEPTTTITFIDPIPSDEPTTTITIVEPIPSDEESTTTITIIEPVPSDDEPSTTITIIEPIPAFSATNGEPTTTITIIDPVPTYSVGTSTPPHSSNGTAGTKPPGTSTTGSPVHAGAGKHGAAISVGGAMVLIAVELLF